MEAQESRTRLRPAIPHVVTQWQANQFRLETTEKPRSSRLATKASNGHLHPDPYVTSSRKPNSIRQSPSLGLLATSPNERWDFGSIRHIRQYSSNDNTPTSTVESVFELASGADIGSPDSSVHSGFIAELEDTSPFPPAIPNRPRGLSSPTKAPTISPSIMDFKSSQITSRAVIKVVDETFAAIEDTNRKLLSRAMAAEEAARRLQEQNSELQLQLKTKGINQAQNRSRHRPRTAPSQPSVSTKPRQRSTTTPLSSFNDTMDERERAATQRQTRSYVPPPRPPRHSSFSPSTPLSRPTHLDLAPSPFLAPYSPTSPSARSRPESSTPLQPRPQFSHRPSNSFSNNKNLRMEISPIIPGSVTRHEVTYAGTPLSYAPRAQIISLDEARRRAKPLPPLGPMSPSTVKGLVEIGPGSDREARRSVDGLTEKKKRGFSGLFKRSKKEVTEKFI